MFSLKRNGTSMYRQSEHCNSTSDGIARKRALTLLEIELANKADIDGRNTASGTSLLHIAYSLSCSCGILVLVITNFKGALTRKFIV